MTTHFPFWIFGHTTNEWTNVLSNIFSSLQRPTTHQALDMTRAYMTVVQKNTHTCISTGCDRELVGSLCSFFHANCFFPIFALCLCPSSIGSACSARRQPQHGTAPSGPGITISSDQYEWNCVTSQLGQTTLRSRRSRSFLCFTWKHLCKAIFLCKAMFCALLDR